MGGEEIRYKGYIAPYVKNKWGKVNGISMKKCRKVNKKITFSIDIRLTIYTFYHIYLIHDINPIPIYIDWFIVTTEYKTVNTLSKIYLECPNSYHIWGQSPLTSNLSWYLHPVFNKSFDCRPVIVVCRGLFGGFWPFFAQFHTFLPANIITYKHLYTVRSCLYISFLLKSNCSECVPSLFSP